MSSRQTTMCIQPLTADAAHAHVRFTMRHQSSPQGHPRQALRCRDILPAVFFLSMALSPTMSLLAPTRRQGCSTGVRMCRVRTYLVSDTIHGPCQPPTAGHPHCSQLQPSPTCFCITSAEALQGSCQSMNDANSGIVQQPHATSGTRVTDHATWIVHDVNDL